MTSAIRLVPAFLAMTARGGCTVGPISSIRPRRPRRLSFCQVADLLSALQSDARSVDDQTESVSVAQRSLALSRRSFQVGNSGVLQVLDSERLFSGPTPTWSSRERGNIAMSRDFMSQRRGDGSV